MSLSHVHNERTAVQGFGNVRIPVRAPPRAEQLRSAERGGRELAGDDKGRQARPESRQHRDQGMYVRVSYRAVWLFFRYMYFVCMKRFCHIFVKLGRSQFRQHGLEVV